MGDFWQFAIWFVCWALLGLVSCGLVPSCNAVLLHEQAYNQG